MPAIFSNPVISILVLIGILIFVHELGHYLVGKYFGFGIETFSIGFGPKIFGFKRGMTTYQISLLPLGGFVKFVGAFPGETIPQEFQGKELANFAVWKRALMTFAGPFANLLLAFVVFVAVGESRKIKPLSEISPLGGSFFCLEQCTKSSQFIKLRRNILSRHFKITRICAWSQFTDC